MRCMHAWNVWSLVVEVVVVLSIKRPLYIQIKPLPVHRHAQLRGWVVVLLRLLFTLFPALRRNFPAHSRDSTGQQSIILLENIIFVQGSKNKLNIPCNHPVLPALSPHFSLKLAVTKPGRGVSRVQVAQKAPPCCTVAPAQSKGKI